mmetsp:Transcript_122669/g.212680  ORF Transcript_122669/g.212680 Transcript_122669/m.212680 type:complete len:80 (+) Transcript_122669:660-899(+)
MRQATAPSSPSPSTAPALCAATHAWTDSSHADDHSPFAPTGPCHASGGGAGGGGRGDAEMHTPKRLTHGGAKHAGAQVR